MLIFLTHPYLEEVMVVKMRPYASIVAGLLLIWATLFIGVVNAAEGLTLGIFPRFNPNQATMMFTPLAEHLAKELNQPVRLKISRDYESFMWSLNTGVFDIVHYNQYHYLRSHRDQGYQVLVRNEERGDDTITGVVIVRSDSGIESVSDLKGKRVIFGGGRGAMMSHIVPKQLLKQGGLAPVDYQTLFARNPPNALIATYTGETDAVGSGAVVLKLEMIQKIMDPSELKVIARGQPLAHLPWAVKQGMSRELSEQVQAILVTLRTSPEGKSVLAKAGLTGLVATTDSDYEPHRVIVKDILGEEY
jgi:phosphonate transport system substrate-binding protein